LRGCAPSTRLVVVLLEKHFGYRFREFRGMLIGIKVRIRIWNRGLVGKGVVRRGWVQWRIWAVKFVGCQIMEVVGVRSEVVDC